jgi:parallel beta-helix repeat protein
MMACLVASGVIINVRETRADRTQPQGIVLYVSTEGNDTWSGSLPSPNTARSDGPLRTPAGARDKIRQLRAKGPLVKPVYVLIRGGVYSLTEPLVFNPEDSGTAENPVVYTNYQGEVPVLSGGHQILNWEPANVSASGEPNGVMTWQAEVPGVKEGKWYFHQLFVNARRCQRARTPNQGFFHAEGEITEDNPAKLKFHEGDIKPAWAQTGDVQVVVLTTWMDYRLFIKSIDPSTRVATLSLKRPFWGAEKDPRYWVENAADALDATGEWYLDRTEGKVLYIPTPGEDLRRAEVMGTDLQQLVRFEGDEEAPKLVHDICLRGITFEYTDWSIPPVGYVNWQAAYDVPAAVEMVGAGNCSIEKCRFAHLGQYAVEIHRGTKKVQITGNEMMDLGAGGVKVGDPKDPNEDGQATEGNVISDNHIHDIGRVYPGAVGIWIGQSSGNTIAHNEIDHTFYTGISVGWTWGYGPTGAHHNVLEANLLHDIGSGMMSDLGCIYTLGVQPGTVERGNVCHDVTRDEHGYGGFGLYTDEGSSGILIENNLVYRTQDGGFHHHYGRDNIVRNNIFAFGQNAEIRRSRVPGYTPIDEPHRGFAFKHNIVFWKDGPLTEGTWNYGRYQFSDNLYFCTGEAPIKFGKWSWKEWQQRGQDVHSVIADPLFVDPEHDDFRLKPGSPALRIGFKPFKIGAAGPQHESSQ